MCKRSSQPFGLGCRISGRWPENENHPKSGSDFRPDPKARVAIKNNSKIASFENPENVKSNTRKREMSLNEQEFWNKYCPIPNPTSDEDLGWDGCLFETFSPHWEYVRDHNVNQPRHLWTLLEVESSLIIASGLQYVNRVGYFITKEPWTEYTETEKCGDI